MLAGLSFFGGGGGLRVRREVVASRLRGECVRDMSRAHDTICSWSRGFERAVDAILGVKHHFFALNW